MKWYYKSIFTEVDFIWIKKKETCLPSKRCAIFPWFHWVWHCYFWCWISFPATQPMPWVIFFMAYWSFFPLRWFALNTGFWAFFYGPACWWPHFPSVKRNKKSLPLIWVAAFFYLFSSGIKFKVMLWVFVKRGMEKMQLYISRYMCGLIISFKEKQNGN